MRYQIEEILRAHWPRGEELTEDSLARLTAAAADISEYLFELDFPVRYVFPTVIDSLEKLAHGQEKLRDEILGRLDERREGGPICRMRSPEADDFHQFILTGGPSLLSQYEGRRQADGHLRSWIDGSDLVICIDPYLFKRSKSEDGADATVSEMRDAEYAQELIDILGRNREVRFFYRNIPGREDTRINPGVANRVETLVAERSLKARFYVVQDLHDRVWLRRDQHTNRWSAKVIGTSREGIGKRPTYLIDMPKDDLPEYLRYVAFLESQAQRSNERPIKFDPAAVD